MRKNILRKKSVTMIELLVAMSIITFVGLGLYRTFCSGISVWKWVRIQRPSADVMIFFDRVAFDLKNYCELADSSFVGSSQKISFLMHDTDYLFPMHSAEPATDETNSLIHRVEYIFLPATQEVKRKQYAFSSDKPEIELTSLSNITNVRFTFYILSGGTDQGGFEQLSSLMHETPKAVEIQVELENERTGTRTFRRIIEIPLEA
ncbi:type II secretion system protein J [Candidatus Omnitrophota bacterium]